MVIQLELVQEKKLYYKNVQGSYFIPALQNKSTSASPSLFLLTLFLTTSLDIFKKNLSLKCALVFFTLDKKQFTLDSHSPPSPKTVEATVKEKGRYDESKHGYLRQSLPDHLTKEE